LAAPSSATKTIACPPRPAIDFKLSSKKNARVLVNYIADLNLILIDHLVSENNDPDNKWTYVPDGDQEGFEWKNGKSLHIDKVFNLKLKDGEAPHEVPILNQRGNQKVSNQ